VERAELERLRAGVEAKRAELQAQVDQAQREAQERGNLERSAASLRYLAELRAFHSDELSLVLGISQASVELAGSRIEAARLLQAQQASLSGTVDEPASDVDASTQYELAMARSEQLQSLEAELRLRLKAAEARRAELVAAYVAPEPLELPDLAIEARLAGWKASMEVQQRRLDAIVLEQEDLLIRAPVSGRVSALQASTGQYMDAGAPILTLSQTEPDSVSVWLINAGRGAPHLGDKFILSEGVRGDDQVAQEARVQRVGVGIEVLPKRLWKDPRMPQYGRACLVGPVSELGLVPGQLVGVRAVVD